MIEHLKELDVLTTAKKGQSPRHERLSKCLFCSDFSLSDNELGAINPPVSIGNQNYIRS